MIRRVDKYIVKKIVYIKCSIILHFHSKNVCEKVKFENKFCRNTQFCRRMKSIIYYRSKVTTDFPFFQKSTSEIGNRNFAAR